MLPVNPNQQNEPEVTKAVGTQDPFSVGRVGISPLTFSGVMLAQAHVEAMQTWAMRRTKLQIDDDLDRSYQGVLTAWVPERVRRPFNPWYHTYSATLTVLAMRAPGGDVEYGDWTSL